MKKTVLVFGLISGLIISTFMAVSIGLAYKSGNFKGTEFVGYSAMIVVFSFIFIGIKNFRDKHNNGFITFGKAFKVGMYISLIASTMYVAVWMIEYYLFVPEFMDKYTEYVIKEAQEKGTIQADIDKKITEMATFKEWYKNPLLVVLLTYMEILPVGLLISLISALILKRKEKNPTMSMAG